MSAGQRTGRELPPADEEAATRKAVRAMAVKVISEMIAELEAGPAGNWQNNRRRAKALRVALDALQETGTTGSGDGLGS